MISGGVSRGRLPGEARGNAHMTQTAVPVFRHHERRSNIEAHVKMNLVKKAVTRRRFPQLPFMSEHGFDSFLRDRGFSVGVAGIRSFVDSGLIETLDAANGDFHPFQIWPISRLFRGLDVQLDAGVGYHGLNPDRLKKYVDLNWTYRAQILTDFPKSVACLDFNHQLFPLLLWLESHFLPLVRGPRPSVVALANSHLYIWHRWRRWTKDSQLGDLLDEHVISIEQLSDWRDKTLVDAFVSDPSPDLYFLLRSMPFDQRDRFRGRLRLAYDLYELAELIRLFLEQVSEQPVKKEWDPTGHPDTKWVERVFGGQPKLGAPGFLRPVVRHYGLDPAYRVRWLVEGETEEGFILRYVERLGANIKEFVTIRNFHGDGALKKQIPAIDADLEAARVEQCFVTLTFDDDDTGDVRKRVENLTARELINFRFVLNKPDFELENFTVDQLVTVAVTWASDLQYRVTLAQETLIRMVKRRIDEKAGCFKKAFNDTLYMKGEGFNMKGERFKLSKGCEWGKRLADHLSDKRKCEAEAGVDSERTLSKIEQQTLFVLRNSQPFIDYPLSIKNLDLSTLEII